MSYSFSVDGRNIPIENYTAFRPSGTDPFVGSVSLKEQGRIDREAIALDLRPDTQVSFSAKERIPNGARGVVLEDQTPLHTVIIWGASGGPNEYGHTGTIMGPTAS
ncbi:MAG: hypothetical protein ACO1QB_18775 [Verrucomicrobiales bacterium]